MPFERWRRRRRGEDPGRGQGDERWQARAAGPRDDGTLLPFGAPTAGESTSQGTSPSSSGGTRTGAGGRGRRGPTERRRSRATLRRLWWSLPVVVVVLVVAAVLIGLHMWSYSAGRSYADGRFTAARDGFEGQMSVTAPVGPERWVADYNLGTTLLAQGYLDVGVQYLQRAMERVPRAHEVAPGLIESYSYECRVRTNLALGLEGQGDTQMSAQAWANAETLYQQSSGLLAPCQSSSSQQQSGQGGQSGEPQSGQSGGSGQSGDSEDQSGGQSSGGGDQGDPGRQAESAKDRVDEKAQEARDRAEGREPSPSPSSSGSQGGSEGGESSPSPQPSGSDDGSQNGGSPSPSPSGGTGSGSEESSDPFQGETEEERQRREELEEKLGSSRDDQDSQYDENRPGSPNGGW